jgi:hypothetical protein
MNFSSRPDLGELWPSRLVATAAEDRLNIQQNSPVANGSQRLSDKAFLDHQRSVK